MAFALRIANDDFPFGFAAAIRTRDVARAHRVAPSSAGVVWVNDHHRLDPASPWGASAIPPPSANTHRNLRQPLQH
nr:aldehyde dehydrogenase family protein [Bradyrhizobium sp. WSM1253]